MDIALGLLRNKVPMHPHFDPVDVRNYIKFITEEHSLIPQNKFFIGLLEKRIIFQHLSIERQNASFLISWLRSLLIVYYSKGRQCNVSITNYNVNKQFPQKKLMIYSEE
jgi:hypothetical protein